MGIVIRQSIKASAAGYFGAILGAISTVFIYPYFLSPEIIGLNRILVDSAFLFAFFAQIGIPNAVIRFSPLLRQNGQIKTAYKYALILPLFSFMFFGLLILIGKETFQEIFIQKSELFTHYIVLVIPFGLICIYLNIIENFSTYYLRITVPKLVREVIIRVLLILAAVVFFLFGLSVDVYVILIIASYGFSALVLAVYFYILFKSKEPVGQNNQINKGIYAKIFSYMGFMLIAGIGSNIVLRVDTFMISAMIGLSGTGIYSISFFMAAMIEIPSRAAIQISSPFVSEYLEKGESEKLKNIYTRYTLNQSVIGGVILLLLWANINNIFALMPKGEIYATGKYVVLFIGLGKFIDVITGLNNQILIYSKYHRYQLLFVVLLGIITIAGNYFLIPIYGITGAALASMISFILLNLTVIIFLYNKLHIQPFTKGFIYVLILIVSGFIINYFLPALKNCFIDALYRSTIISIYCIAFVIIFKLSEDINRVAGKLFSKGILMHYFSKKPK
ncbi:MAG: oligosaccharide flippase family protein [Bacteroidales bacterium]|nr:oligosaccharide flippase family protein [Bacteroidales bacterium]MBN2821249.1 oligosaccharide flippase family protein [Bacteroidales bacterium]